MDLEQRLRDLESDHASGAVSLALQAVSISEAWLREGLDRKSLSLRLRSMHPAIAAVANVGRAVERGDDLVALERSLRDGKRRIAERLATCIAPLQTILSISNSSTVREALTTSLRPRLVLALVSEPGGEGALLAESLAAAGIPVRLEPDAAMGRLLDVEADFALVGADSFDATGALIHKAGTLPLALCCRQFGKRLIAAGHSVKRVGGRLTRQPTDARFDLTPAELVTEIVTEEGS